MSKKDDTPFQSGGENGGGETTPQAIPKGAPTFRAIEEHAAALHVAAPVFAAVRQAMGWADGKKVEKTAFEKAVKDFLGAPMGGK
jgi:hypothetical protein